MKKSIYIISSIILLINTACNKGKNNPESCNGESTRRDVKLVVDDDALEVDTIPITTSVDSIGSIDLIEAKSETNRQDIEKMVFKITAKVDKVKKHRDGDYKIKLVDENEKYINCEVPNTGCSYVSDSRFYDNYVAVREWIEENKGDIEGETVTVIGVAFIDIDHGYPRNNSDNEIELHPILDIYFE